MKVAIVFRCLRKVRPHTVTFKYISTDNCIEKPLKNSTLHWHKIRLLHTQITEKIKNEIKVAIVANLHACVCVKVDHTEFVLS
jgi:hypothetical protein